MIGNISIIELGDVIIFIINIFIIIVIIVILINIIIIIKSFDEKDKDGSGTISVEEAVGKGSWDQWIKLKTEEERRSKANTGLRKWVEYRTAWVKDHDKNGDGVLQFNEYWAITNNPTEVKI